MSFAGVIQIYSDETETFLKFNTLVAYSIHVGWLNFTAIKKRSMTDRRHTVLGFLLAGAAELRDGDGEQNVKRKYVYSRVCIVRGETLASRHSANALDGCAEDAHQNAVPSNVTSFETSECWPEQCRLFRNLSKMLRRVDLRLRWKPERYATGFR